MLLKLLVLLDKYLQLLRYKNEIPFELVFSTDTELHIFYPFLYLHRLELFPFNELA